jgi:hypothetical protein
MRDKDGLCNGLYEAVCIASLKETGDGISAVCAHHDKHIFPFEQVVKEAVICISFQGYKTYRGITIL